MARTELGAIIDELVTHQTTLDVGPAYDEPPESIDQPCWLNFPVSGSLNTFAHGAEDFHTIGICYVMGRSLLEINAKKARPIITKLADQLDGDLDLGATVEFWMGLRYEYGLIETISSPEMPLFGLYFELDVVVKDAETATV